MPEEQTLNVHIPTRIDQAIARENSRYAVNGAHLRFSPYGMPVAEATDGHMLAAVQCDGDTGEHPSTIVPATLLEKRRSGTRLAVNGTITNEKGISAEPCKGNFPPAHDVTPRELSRNRVDIALNPQLLAKLAKAIGDGQSVTLSIQTDDKGNAKENKPIVVLDQSNPSRPAIGLLMPINRRDPEDMGERYSRYRRELFGGK